MRGWIAWGLWITVAAALAGPQQVIGALTASESGDASTAPPNAPADPVILEPIRPLVPDQTSPAAVRTRDCGSPEVLMMAAGALFSLMLDLVPRRTRSTGRPQHRRARFCTADPNRESPR